MLENKMPTTSHTRTAWVFWARLLIALLQGACFFILFLYDKTNQIVLEYPSIIILLPVPTLVVVPLILMVFMDRISFNKIPMLFFINFIVSIFISYITLFNPSDLIERKQLLDNNVDRELIFFINIFHILSLFLINSFLLNHFIFFKINTLKYLAYDLFNVILSFIIAIFIVFSIIIFSQAYFIYTPIARTIVFYSIFAISIHCLDGYHPHIRYRHRHE